MNHSFQTTRWTLVLRASSSDAQERRQALTELLGQNWYPLYSFLRHGGTQASEAEDLIQGFFVRVIENDLLAGLDQHRQGRFRSFLLVCLKRYASNQWRADKAEKRGGGRTVSMDFESADQRFQLEPSDIRTPEKAFERAWAMEMIERSLEELSQKWSEKGKGDQYERLKVFLSDDDTPRTQVAEELGVSVQTLNVQIHRLKAEFRQCLCNLVSDTLGREELLEDELNSLFLALVE